MAACATSGSETSGGEAGPSPGGATATEASGADADAQTAPSGAGSAARPGKRALIIGIGDYPEPAVNGYRHINSTNDIPLIEAALRTQGFPASAIRILRDADADREGILGALDTLINASEPNDVVFVHYSGHGDQLTDDSGDELDGYDEVLVPFGAPANEYFKSTYGADAAARATAYARDLNGFKHVRDDDLNERLARLREQVGPRGNVVFSIDACHSGTGTRGDAGPMPRGPDDPIGEPAAGARSGSGPPDGAGMFEVAASDTRPGLAPYVVLSASRQGEKDWETRDDDGTAVGPLSLALSRVLPRVRPGETYQALYDRVAVAMSSLAPRQVPQIEGHSFTEVFSGRAVPYEPYYRVADVPAPDQVIVLGGALNGVTRGSRVAFYPIGGGPSASTEPPLARGTVTLTDHAEARVAIDPGVASSVDMRQTWAFVTESAFGELALAVQLDRSVDPADRSELTTALTARGLARLVEDRSIADLVVRADMGPYGAPGLTVSTAVDALPVGDRIPRTAASTDAVRDRVENYARNRYLKRIEMRGGNVDVRLTIVPATHWYSYRETVRGRVRLCTSDVNAPGGALRLASAERTWQLADSGAQPAPGESREGFLLEFENAGSRPAHIAVLELYPDGRIEQMFPPEEQEVAEVTLAPGQKVLFKGACFRATPPYGVYVYKLFATDATNRQSRPIDFRPVLTRRATRGTLGPFERLLDSTYARTRSDNETVALDGASTDAVLVKVVPR